MTDRKRPTKMAGRKKPTKLLEKLGENHLIFCKEFVVDGNGARSAKAAGFSVKTAKEQAVWLLDQPLIQAEINELNEKRSKRLEVSADRVLEELAKIAFVDATTIFDVDEKGNFTFTGKLSDLSPEERACIAEVTQTKTVGGGSIKVKLHDKLSALEKIGKHLKLFTDVTESKFELTQMGKVMIGDTPLEFDIGQDPNELEG